MIQRDDAPPVPERPPDPFPDPTKRDPAVVTHTIAGRSGRMLTFWAGPVGERPSFYTVYFAADGTQTYSRDGEPIDALPERVRAYPLIGPLLDSHGDVDSILSPEDRCGLIEAARRAAEVAAAPLALSWRVFIGQWGDWTIYDETFASYAEARAVLLTRLHAWKDDACGDCRLHASEAFQRLESQSPDTEFIANVEGDDYALVRADRDLDTLDELEDSDA